MPNDQVIVYSSDNCVPCEWVKGYLQRKQVPFQVFNVSHDEPAREALARLGYQGTPVTVIKGQCFTGFNQKKIEAALIEAGFLKPAPSA
jgi:glutaredoxin